MNQIPQFADLQTWQLLLMEPDSSSILLYPFCPHLAFKDLETAALPVNDWPLWGKCALTLLTLIAADHKAAGTVSPGLTLMERTVLGLKRQVNLLFCLQWEI